MILMLMRVFGVWRACSCAFACLRVLRSALGVLLRGSAMVRASVGREARGRERWAGRQAVNTD